MYGGLLAGLLLQSGDRNNVLRCTLLCSVGVAWVGLWGSNWCYLITELFDRGGIGGS
jgi:hypothetical protein